MDFHPLRAKVASANQAIASAGLVELSFGNASGVDRAAGVFAIKPSGVACSEVLPDQVVLVSLADGRVIDSELRPSSDTPTHLHLYRSFDEIGGVVHTHSTFATSWAQARRPIPCLGTTHADHFHGEVPVTRPLLADEVGGTYETSTGEVIVERFAGDDVDPFRHPGVLVASHGPFTWGADPDEAVVNAVAIEVIARMAYQTQVISGGASPIEPFLLDRHFQRKHGPHAYYGQAKPPRR
jgi:L-ribulose-5-phosphate 4-epimerase